MKRAIAGAAGAGTLGLLAARLLKLDRQVGRMSRLWADHNLGTFRHLFNSGYLGQRADARFHETLDAEPFIIVGMGDSSVQGIGAKSPRMSLLPYFAGAVGNYLGVTPDFVNLSVSGEVMTTLPTRQCSAALGSELIGDSRTPNVTILCIGGNDVMDPQITKEKFAYFARVTARLIPEGSLVGNIPSFAFMPQDARAAALSRILEEIMVEHGHHIVDLRGFSESLGVADYAMRYHASDMFHPNSRAYEQWARLFFDKWAQVHGYADARFVSQPLPLNDSSRWNQR